MRLNRIVLVVSIVLVLSIAVVPSGVMAQPDECMNADRGPDNGPPGFVADLVPNFLSDLIGSLPVPNFVKTFFGAPTC